MKSARRPRTPLDAHCLKFPRGYAQMLAARLGVAPETVAHWRSGRVRPSMRYALEIQDATGITPQEWVAWDREKTGEVAAA